MDPLVPTLEPMPFRIDTTIPEGKSKKVTLLSRTDRVVAAVQVIQSGGENNLHSHAHLDGVWTVLAGRATFYGPGDVIMAELGPYEGIMIPRGVQYWFESGDESQQLVIHQVEASDISMMSIEELVADRINHEVPKESLADNVAAAAAQ